MLAEAQLERYSSPQGFAAEVNLPLLGSAAVPAIPPGASAATLLQAPIAEGLRPVVDGLMQTRQSLTLRSLLLAGFPHDPEGFALGLALAREWSRRGLKIALVDLDFRHPSVVRPGAGGGEGLVDVLEYGCSFRRVAWELVADRLWLIGPGSHPPDEERLVEHPDWERASRVLAAHVDAVLYVAPHLDRPGLTGRLSKRMDGVLITVAVERVERSGLRDAFLELWGSDAPIIGCVGIVPPASAPRPAEARSAGPEAHARSGAADPIPSRPAASTETIPEAPPEEALVAQLEREIRTGRDPSAARRVRGRLTLAVAGFAIVAVVAGAAWVALRSPGALRSTKMEETLPAGTERVLPAQLPTGSDKPLPGGAAPPAGEATPDAATSRGAGDAPARPVGALPYTVHVASFRSERTVEELARSLRARGLDARYEPARDLPGWYRVFVGRYATHAEAEAAAASLLTRGLVDRAHAYPESER